MKIEMYRKPGRFFILSTAFPWILWFMAAYISHARPGNKYLADLSSIIALSGLLAPIGVAIYMSKDNREVARDMVSRFFNFKGIRPVYYILTLFLMLASILLAQAVSLLFGYSADQFRLAGAFSFSSGLFPAWFMLIISPILEELAWHTYGTDSLRSRYSLFKTSLIFALFWGVWHFPLSFIRDYYHSNLVEEGWIYPLNFIVSIIPFVFIMNWIYYKANRNILLPVVFHITAGFFNEIFATHPMSKVIQTGLLLILSVYIVLKEKKLFFTRSLAVDTTTKPFRRRGAAKKSATVAIVTLFTCFNLSSQSLNSVSSYRDFENSIYKPIPFSTVIIMNANPIQGVVISPEEYFILSKLTLGWLTPGDDNSSPEGCRINGKMESPDSDRVFPRKERTLSPGISSTEPGRELTGSGSLPLLPVKVPYKFFNTCPDITTFTNFRVHLPSPVKPLSSGGE